VPRDYDAARAWPAILFLHGAGQRGNDNEAQGKVGIGPHILRNQDRFGFIVVLPQCPQGKWWTAREQKAYAMAALERTREEFHVDSDRIYLTGISMGGMGTWALAADQSQVWAAIVPICGPGDPLAAAKVAHLPCWYFHGTADRTVPVQMGRTMMDALKRRGGHPRYTEYEGVGHNSWDRAYATDELFAWMLAQRRNQASGSFPAGGTR
jgi:predicted peptidase